jgi:hypothetical protein
MHPIAPIDLLQPVFDLLEQFFDDYGLYLFIAFVHLLIPFSVWALTGGLRRKLQAGKSASCVPPVRVIYLPIHPPPPPPGPEPFPPFCEPPDYDHDDYCPD